MTAPLTDTEALARSRARTVPDEMFLHRLVAEDLEDRLSIVNRTFTDVALVTGHPDFWRDQSLSLPKPPEIVPTQETLPLGEAAFDLVLHLMDLHWANDPVGQLIQCRRALRPDGHFIAILFGGRTLEELRACLGQAEIEIAGGLSPRVAPMGEVRDLGALLQRAGFALPVAEAMAQTVSYPSPLHLMRSLRGMGEANVMTERLRRPTRRAVLLRAAEIYQREYGDAAGRVPATFELMTLTGWAPDASQPQPLRPGSAQARLADALGTSERPLED